MKYQPLLSLIVGICHRSGRQFDFTKSPPFRVAFLGLLVSALSVVLLVLEAISVPVEALDQDKASVTTAMLEGSFPALTNTSSITITAIGFDPAVLTVTVGTEVTWYNATDAPHTLKSGVPYQIFLPLVLRDTSASREATTIDRVKMLSPLLQTSLNSDQIISATLPPGGTFTHQFTNAGDFPLFLATAPHLTGRIIVQEEADPNIPCLLVIARLNSVWDYNILAGCVTGRGGPSTIEWRYDSQTGAISGFDLTIKDSQGIIFYQASIEIQRSNVGQIASYGGIVSGDNFSTFTETIVNQYDPSHGGFIGADVVKVYSTSGDEYMMELTSCGPSIDWSGYRVKVWGGPYQGEELTVGNCN